MAERIFLFLLGLLLASPGLLTIYIVRKNPRAFIREGFTAYLKLILIIAGFALMIISIFGYFAL
ncbi:hypothetical protein OO013_11980 [Mangrovivirga sp. M17]|uniref:Uncharacterized protein n=1 Tax=Mangrovivirga halotolerans TaxID=2993936 RepID=A0ABT3RSX1_9BACT|nr:hypothetical protein [Mangrovivirga halotolerans]MCX2744591.1 hypothetical protein [Mangrovivirga halotolerans]